MTGLSETVVSYICSEVLVQCLFEIVHPFMPTYSASSESLSYLVEHIKQVLVEVLKNRLNVEILSK